MGEAKRRQTTAGRNAGNGNVMVDRDKLALALGVALAPIGEQHGIHGADCVLYARVGAEALRHLGLPAHLRVGDALWRVGPNDHDVIHHVANMAGTLTFGPAHLKHSVFHAWIGIEAHGAMPAQLVDFTTWQLRDKARLLDQADGKRTRVDFCPDYLWVPEKCARSMTVPEVTDSFTKCMPMAVRHVEGLKLPSEETVRMLVEVVLYIYGELLAGREPSAQNLPLP